MFNSLSALAGPAAYVVVAVLAALEASAFVGLFVPGELALLTGGYIAFSGRANLGIMMAAAAAGAIVGDSVGYEIGRHFGPRLRQSRLGRRVGQDRWERADAYLATKGGRAILAGRFIGVLRALVPAVAGATRMPYRRFVLWNVLGAIVWAPGTVLVGYLAGSSYQRVERYAGRAGLVLLVVLAATAGIVASARWISRHPEQVRRTVTAQLARPRVAGLARRYQSQLTFLANRFRPGNALGLALTAQLAVLAGAGWAFGTLLQDVIGTDGVARIDLPVVRYLADHRTAWLTATMRQVTWLGSTMVLGPLVLILGIDAKRRSRSWATMSHLLLGLSGAVVLDSALEPLVGRPRPQVGQLVSTATGYAFPSGHATQTAAVAVTLALLSGVALRSWKGKVAVWAAAALVTMFVGFSRLYLGVQWPTDVLGGYALGAGWATAAFLAIRWRGTVSRPSRRGHEGGDAPHGAEEVLPSTPEHGCDLGTR